MNKIIKYVSVAGITLGTLAAEGLLVNLGKKISRAMPTRPSLITRIQKNTENTTSNSAIIDSAMAGNYFVKVQGSDREYLILEKNKGILNVAANLYEGINMKEGQPGLVDITKCVSSNFYQNVSKGDTIKENLLNKFIESHN